MKHHVGRPDKIIHVTECFELDPKPKSDLWTTDLYADQWFCVPSRINLHTQRDIRCRTFIIETYKIRAKILVCNTNHCIDRLSSHQVSRGIFVASIIILAQFIHKAQSERTISDEENTTYRVCEQIRAATANATR